MTGGYLWTATDRLVRDKWLDQTWRHKGEVVVARSWRRHLDDRRMAMSDKMVHDGTERQPSNDSLLDS